MSTETKHSPLPFIIHTTLNGPVLRDADGNFVDALSGINPRTRADAAFLCHAANCHYDLIAAMETGKNLRDAANRYKKGNLYFPWQVVRELLDLWIEQYDSALAKAKGEQTP